MGHFVQSASVTSPFKNYIMPAWLELDHWKKTIIMSSACRGVGKTLLPRPSQQNHFLSTNPTVKLLPLSPYHLHNLQIWFIAFIRQKELTSMKKKNQILQNIPFSCLDTVSEETNLGASFWVKACIQTRTKTVPMWTSLPGLHYLGSDMWLLCHARCLGHTTTSHNNRLLRKTSVSFSMTRRVNTNQ